LSRHQQRILVIEDEIEIARLVELHLRDLGYEVDRAETAAEGLRLAADRLYVLVVLDLMLPDRDGLEVCRDLRGRKNYIPILMLTARSTEIDRVLGLEIGADDYLTKPFAIRELTARVKALLRRVRMLENSERDAPQQLTMEGLTIDPEKRRVEVDGEPAELTAKEFDLLLQFAKNPGRVYTRSQLLDLVWGFGSHQFEHTVNSHINRLRAKIEKDPAKPRFVQTVWGVGYRFLDPENTEQ
jgi:DNA-binding response OmpR family regulator